MISALLLVLACGSAPTPAPALKEVAAPLDRFSGEGQVTFNASFSPGPAPAELPLCPAGVTMDALESYRSEGGLALLEPTASGWMLGGAALSAEQLGEAAAGLGAKRLLLRAPSGLSGATLSAALVQLGRAQVQVIDVACAEGQSVPLYPYPPLIGAAPDAGIATVVVDPVLERARMSMLGIPGSVADKVAVVVPVVDVPVLLRSVSPEVRRHVGVQVGLSCDLGCAVAAVSTVRAEPLLGGATVRYDGLRGPEAKDVLADAEARDAWVKTMRSYAPTPVPGRADVPRAGGQ